MTDAELAELRAALEALANAKRQPAKPAPAWGLGRFEADQAAQRQGLERVVDN